MKKNMNDHKKIIKGSLTRILGEAAFNNSERQVPKDIQVLVKCIDYIVQQTLFVTTIPDRDCL